MNYASINNSSTPHFSLQMVVVHQCIRKVANTYVWDILKGLEHLVEDMLYLITKLIEKKYSQ